MQLKRLSSEINCTYNKILPYCYWSSLLIRPGKGMLASCLSTPSLKPVLYLPAKLIITRQSLMLGTDRVSRNTCRWTNPSDPFLLHTNILASHYFLFIFLAFYLIIACYCLLCSQAPVLLPFFPVLCSLLTRCFSILLPEVWLCSFCQSVYQVPTVLSF